MYSKYQEAIFAFVRGETHYQAIDPSPIDWNKPLPEDYYVDFQGKRNMVVEAVAGSGKTTTIVKALDFIKSGSIEDAMFGGQAKALFVAFNSHIAEELRRRVPSYVQASTLNSAGWGICRANSPGVEMDVKKTENILRVVSPTNSTEERAIFYKIKNPVCKMVSLFKALLVQSMDEAHTQFDEIADKYDVEAPQLDDPNFNFKQLTIDVWQRAISNIRYMDFDDQIAAPIINNWSFPRYDWVFGDEAQDWSPVQIELVKRLGASGRIVAVGDRHQSIYGFRGADPDAIPNIIRALDATVQPLSICYRCPNKVIAAAREIVPHIESPVDNPKGEGIVKRLRTEEFIEQVRDGDYVLCRTTAPLVKRCLQQISIGKKATVKGKDIGAGLIGLMQSLCRDDRTDIATFLSALAQYKAEQVEKLIKCGRDEQASTIEDRCDTLDALATDCNIIADVIKRIKTIFTDTDSDGIIFMTGHRSKGLEAKRIFWLRPDLCPHPKSKKSWQLIQEHNLRYVIMTRSLAELYLVSKEKDER